MSRHTFSSTINRMARAAAQAERARMRSMRQHQAAVIWADRLAERQFKAGAREQAHAYAEMRLQEVEDLSQEVVERDAAIDGLLKNALETDPRINLNGLKQAFSPGQFQESDRWFLREPDWAIYTPPRPNFLARLIPGAGGRYERQTSDAKSRFESDFAHYQLRMQERAAALTEFEFQEAARAAGVAAQNRKFDDLAANLNEGDHEAVLEFYGMLLERSFTEECDAVGAEVGYSPPSKHLVVDLELPEISVVPDVSGYKYVKSADRIDPTARTISKRQLAYAGLIQRSVLKCIDTVFRGGGVAVDVLTLNGMLETIDPATGQNIRVCLLSARITSDAFRGLNLAQVQPDQCLRSLKASVSKSPAELLPVKPLVEIDMVDPRFIETREVLSGLDTRSNLMELTPGEFEGLITNLFGSMGLETRQTQASRDGGVDCVAFDLRPILGGKVVIQAKRYKNTVGVSAVRDLFGTMQNEGANRGILVTTSGYGKASHDFAKGKPLELIDGSGLLHLLAEHAGVEAKIVMPNDWVNHSNLSE